MRISPPFGRRRRDPEKRGLVPARGQALGHCHRNVTLLSQWRMHIPSRREAAGIIRPALARAALAQASGEKQSPWLSGTREEAARAELCPGFRGRATCPPKLRSSAGGSREEGFGTQRRREGSLVLRDEGEISIREWKDCNAPEGGRLTRSKHSSKLR